MIPMVRPNLPNSLFFAASLMVVATFHTVQAQEGQSAVEADSSQSGVLYEELARMDSVLFDASFVSCNAEVANAIFADDVEFLPRSGRLPVERAGSCEHPCAHSILPSRAGDHEDAPRRDPTGISHPRLWGGPGRGPPV
jgi:hypothetical protein